MFLCLLFVTQTVGLTSGTCGFKGSSEVNEYRREYRMRKDCSPQVTLRCLHRGKDEAMQVFAKLT